MTRFEYDRLGRMTKRTLPLGEYETMAYDAAGNFVSKTDFNGQTTTFIYDDQNRMTSRTFPGESPVSFTYDDEGRRLTAEAESFAYDSRGRLISNTKPNGEQISYTYDAVGNRTSITDPHGTTTYTFDELNRVETVTDPENGVTTYGYDPVGAVASVALPNGVVTTHSYNARNHPTRIESRDAANTILAAYAYQPDATGRHQGVIDEHSNRSVTWIYDLAYRLGGEDIYDAYTFENIVNYYFYDDVGNRLTKTDWIAGNTTYQYDQNDHLTAETTSELTTSYGYDANVAKIADGNRINFLVDNNRTHSQVLRETAASGSEIAHRVFGRRELIRSVFSWPALNIRWSGFQDQSHPRCKGFPYNRCYEDDNAGKLALHAPNQAVLNPDNYVFQARLHGLLKK